MDNFLVSTQGCGDYVIFDGDQKCTRSVCAAALSGYINMYGNTHITGCRASPAYNSRFCDAHKQYVLRKWSMVLFFKICTQFGLYLLFKTLPHIKSSRR